MRTIIQTVTEEQLQGNILEQASKILRQGGLVAFPTETVYGLGADALKEEAAKKIYAAKGRPSDNPLIVHISKVEDLSVLCKEVPEVAYKLAEAFWPGPLTMILNKNQLVPYGTTGGLDTVAIRMPNNKITLKLIDQSGVYIAGPSANTSGRPSPTLASHVKEDLDGKIDWILDGGEVGIGIESTIVDLTSEVPTILRPGYITPKMLEEVVGKVQVDKAILKENQESNLVPKAPGMKYKHYAPIGDLTVVEGSTERVIAWINQRAKEQSEMGYRVGVLATDETKNSYEADIVMTVGTRNDEVSISKGLYKVLREFDQLKAEYIYAESFTEDEFGQAIMNRLLKAAGYHIITV